MVILAHLYIYVRECFKNHMQKISLAISGGGGGELQCLHLHGCMGQCVFHRLHHCDVHLEEISILHVNVPIWFF